MRLIFSGPLAAAAFGPGASVAGLYVVTSTDGAGASPGISAAIAVPGATGNVELALNLDLVAGGMYSVASLGVPAVDTSVSPAGLETFMFGALTAPTLNVEQTQDDLGALVYGVDLVWTGADFLETPQLDLATISGVPNVQGAMHRRLQDRYGIPWDRAYGAKADNYVNGPAPNGLGLLGALRRQAVADNRVASGTVAWQEDPANPGDNYFPVAIVLRGAAPGQGFTVAVNPSGTT